VNQKPINLSSQDITQAEIDAVLEVMRSERLSIGPKLDAFETALAQRAGRKFGIGVNSGTSGLHLCVKALDIGPGDEVITTPFSFVATTNCLLFVDATPVFVDIDPDSYNMDPQAVEAAITPRTKAILPVEVFGNTAHFDTYEQIAKKHDLLFIEDCCEALGGSLNNKPAGSFGQCGVFAFYPNKQITTGEGGMIVTDSEEIRDMCVSLRNQGRATEAWLSHARLGYNYRMSEIAAALGLVQTERLDEILDLRRGAAEMYNQALADVEELHLPPMSDPQTASWFVYVVRLADRFTQADRDAVLNRLRDGGIACSIYFVPIHIQPYVTEKLGTKAGDFPLTEHLAARTIALPFFARISDQQIARIKTALVEAIASL
jgi:perosamine synthetase